MLREGKSNDEVIKLCSLLQTKHQNAVWVYREIGAAELRQKHWSEAVGPLLKAVKLDGKDAQSWENLGLSYFNLGRLASSKKALDRALNLDKNRPYSNLIRAWIHTHVALESAEHGREVSSPLYFMTQAYQLYRQSMRHIIRGALCTAKPLLEKCWEDLTKCISMDGTICAAHKLRGDVAFVKLKIDILGKMMNGERVHLDQGLKDWDKAKVSIRRSYAKAIHLRPYESTLWSNMSLSLGTRKSREHHVDINLLASFETVERCLRAGIRLQPDSSKHWLYLGSFLLHHDPGLSKYAFVRSLQLDQKGFNAWECMTKILGNDSLEKGFCERQAQTYKEDDLDVWSRIISSKCDTESEIYSRINVADLFGPHLMESYLRTCFAEDAAGGSPAYAAALTASCLDPFNPDLLLSLWLLSLRYGKFDMSRNMYDVFHDEMHGAAVFSEIPGLLTTVLSHLATTAEGEVLGLQLPPFSANNPEYARSLAKYLKESPACDSVYPQLVLYLFETIITFYREQPTKLSDCMDAIREILLYGSRCIYDFVSTHQDELSSRLNTMYVLIGETEGRDVELKMLQTEMGSFSEENKTIPYLFEIAKKILITRENKTVASNHATDSSEECVCRVELIKTLHMYPWMMVPL